MVWWMGLLCLALGAGAQSFPVVKYTTREGLGNSIVYRVYQDKKGLLWLSTDNGLTRYDGQHFKNFTTHEGLRASYIFGLTENDTSMLISAFGGGIQFSNGSEIDSVTTIAPQIEYPISVLYHDQALWTIDRRLRLFRTTSRGTEQLSGTSYTTGKNVNTIGVSSLGLTACSYGLFVYDTARQQLREVTIDWGNPPNVYVQWFVELPDQKMLVSANSLFLVDLVTRKATKILDGHFQYGSRNLLACRDGSFLAAENTGVLWRFNRDFTRHEKILEGVVINDMYQDSEGGIWLGTHGQGLWHLPTLHVRYFPISGLLSPTITFSRTEGCAVVTSLNKPMMLVDSARVRLAGHARVPAVVQPGITAFTETANGQINLATLHGLVRMRGTRADSLSFGFPQTSLLSNADGSLWSGARTGLYQINPSFTGYTAWSFFKDKIVRALTRDDANTVWAGTSSGLFAVPSTPEAPSPHSFFAGQDITALHFDPARQVLWVGTHNGLFQIDTAYTIREKYPNVRVHTIIADKRHHIWAGTTKGEVYFDGQRLELFTEKEGIPRDLLRHAYDPQTDLLYLLSATGVSVLHGQGFLANRAPVQPTLFVTDQIRDGQRSVSAQALQSLPASTQSITLLLASSYFQNTEPWNLYYRINEQAWTHAGQTRELRFFELPRGQGRIDVKLRDDINGRESTILTLPYFIEIPFFQKPLFLWCMGALAVMAGVGLTVVTMRAVAQRKQRKLFAQQRKIELEQKVLRNMLNPHFLNNAVNSIQVFVTRNDQRKTLGYLAKFARLMRVNIELLEKSLITLEKEIQNIELYLAFEQLRFDGKLEYEITLSPDINPAQITVPSLVLQPFVENAIWHGILPQEQGGKVAVSVYREQQVLVLEIDDNGIGLHAAQARPKAHPGNVSKGMSLIRERFDLLNQQRPGYSFTIEDKATTHAHASGTRVRLRLPLS